MQYHEIFLTLFNITTHSYNLSDLVYLLEYSVQTFNYSNYHPFYPIFLFNVIPIFTVFWPFSLFFGNFHCFHRFFTPFSLSNCPKIRLLTPKSENFTYFYQVNTWGKCYIFLTLAFFYTIYTPLTLCANQLLAKFFTLLGQSPVNQLISQ